MSAMKNKKNGFTLIELMVAVGLFALVMLLASGAYLLMIGLNRQAQGMATGIDNLSFALETMTRTIRTGTNYSCGIDSGASGDCLSGDTSFSVTNSSGKTVQYSLLSDVIMQQTGSDAPVPLTDPSVDVKSLVFYVSGALSYIASGNTDIQQPHVTIVVSGTVSLPGKPPQDFHVETGATMRGTDL